MGVLFAIVRESVAVYAGQQPSYVVSQCTASHTTTYTVPNTVPNATTNSIANSVADTSANTVRVHDATNTVAHASRHTILLVVSKHWQCL